MKGKALRALCLVALALGVLWNVLYSVADLAARRNQPQATRLAMRLAPGNAAFPAQLADEVFASDPQQAQALLAQSVRQNPYNAGNWIHLALLREAGNDVPGAEAALARAAAVDTTFLPSWSLANFYFRQNNAARFWYWGERAAQMAPDDITALLRLAWYQSPDAPEIEDRLQLKSPALASQFVRFLVTQRDLGGVSEAASRLAAMPAAAGSTQTLLDACDWLLEQKRPDLALMLWNRLASRTGYDPPTADSPLTNANFSRSPVSHGFDWRVASAEGVTVFWNQAPNALGFEFSGTEPDHVTLLRQVAPVRAGSNYSLAIDYGTTGIAPESGLRWQISDPHTGAVLAQTSLSAGRDTARACFAAPTSFVETALLYQRQPGTVRIEGKLALKKIRLAPGACST